MKINTYEQDSRSFPREIELVRANQGNGRAKGFCTGAASQLRTPLVRGKAHLLELNTPMPCPPRGTVPVNQAWLWSSSLSPRGSSSVRDATTRAMYPERFRSPVAEPRRIEFEDRPVQRFSFSQQDLSGSYDHATVVGTRAGTKNSRQPSLNTRCRLGTILKPVEVR
jgi:hypothetical protein